MINNFELADALETVGDEYITTELATNFTCMMRQYFHVDGLDFNEVTRSFLLSNVRGYIRGYGLTTRQMVVVTKFAFSYPITHIDCTPDQIGTMAWRMADTLGIGGTIWPNYEPNYEPTNDNPFPSSDFAINSGIINDGSDSIIIDEEQYATLFDNIAEPVSHGPQTRDLDYSCIGRDIWYAKDYRGVSSYATSTDTQGECVPNLKN